MGNEMSANKNWNAAAFPSQATRVVAPAVSNEELCGVLKSMLADPNARIQHCHQAVIMVWVRESEIAASEAMVPA